MTNKAQIQEQIQLLKNRVKENELLKAQAYNKYNSQIMDDKQTIKKKETHLKVLELDFENMAVDTLLSTTIGNRYFSHFEDNIIYCFASGRTSRTCFKNQIGKFCNFLGDTENILEVLERPEKPWLPIKEFTDIDMGNMRVIEFRGTPKSIVLNTLLGSNVGEIDVEINYVTHFRKTNENN